MTNMLTDLKLPLIGRHHSGIDDSRNIAAIARALINEGYVFVATGSKNKKVSQPIPSSESVGHNTPKVKQGEGKGNAIHVEGKKKNQKAPPPPIPFCGNIVDIGANLYNKSFPEHHLPEVLERARRDANVVHIMLTGTSLKGSKEGIEMCKKFNAMDNASERFPKLTCTVGVHPHDAGHALKNPNIIADLRTLILENRDIVVAVGECGLDFDRNFSTPSDQIAMFQQQIDLALDLDLPLFLHERSAFDKTVEMLTTSLSARPQLTSLKGVIHCFTGESEEVVATYLGLGLHIGITGWVADLRPGRGAGLAAIVNKIPLDRLMVETDCPYLTPRNVKPLPKVNEPALLPHVVQAVADCYGLPAEEIGEKVDGECADVVQSSFLITW
ncbi:hypothetical protein BC829DRAFT_460033 [Chytridium lagenaria]|nr:hypothetical protein BC829DRAFT_460033 [Chytridium lagenaria]